MLFMTNYISLEHDKQKTMLRTSLQANRHRYGHNKKLTKNEERERTKKGQS